MTAQSEGTMKPNQLKRILDAVQTAMAELEAIEKQEDWFISDSLEQLKKAETELLLEIENLDG